MELFHQLANEGKEITAIRQQYSLSSLLLARLRIKLKQLITNLLITNKKHKSWHHAVSKSDYNFGLVTSGAGGLKNVSDRIGKTLQVVARRHPVHSPG